MSAPARKRPASNVQRWQAPGICLALAAITFAVFGQTLRHEFVDLDDGDYVYENPMVARGLTIKGIVWAFTQFHSANWHPLTWLSHMLDCQLYGLNPAGHHLTNVLLHAATVIALFLVLRQMTGALWRSAFVAAVFAIHPLRVETVAWVAERKDVLSGLFFMLTIGAYVRYARGPRSWRRYVLVMLLFAMGLMSKPMLVTLPLVLLLLDYWPLRRMEPRKISGLVTEKLPLLALSAAACVVTLLAQNKALSSTAFLPLPLRCANALATCMVYLGQMVYPAGLAVFYPYPFHGLPPWELVLAGTLLAGLSAVAAWQRRKQPWMLMGWFWYLAMLLPVVGIIQVGGQAHADRYTYLPQIGIYIVITWLVAEWCAMLRVGRAAIGSLMIGVLAVLMFCAWKQTWYWKNDETLWTHAINHTEDNNLAHNNLGKALFRKGNVEEAIIEFQKSLQIKPDYAEAHLDLGNAFFHKGSLDEAISEFQTALRIRPNYAEAHLNFGLVLFKKGNLDEAITEYQNALRIKPLYAEAHYSLGTAFLQKDRVDDAITEYQNALQIRPDYAEAHSNLGNILAHKGKADEAIAHFQKALQIAPANPSIQNNLAWLLATGAEASLRNGHKALELAQQANELTGGENPLILHTLAAAFAENGQFSEAVETAQRALRLAEAHSNSRLAGQLKTQLELYHAGKPFHGPAQIH
jgi:tetratricopeptide (TPR) repeat protein